VHDKVSLDSIEWGARTQGVGGSGEHGVRQAPRGAHEFVKALGHAVMMADGSALPSAPRRRPIAAVVQRNDPEPTMPA
jgi:hypothetical protein